MARHKKEGSVEKLKRIQRESAERFQHSETGKRFQKALDRGHGRFGL